MIDSLIIAATLIIAGIVLLKYSRHLDAESAKEYHLKEMLNNRFNFVKRAEMKAYVFDALDAFKKHGDAQKACNSNNIIIVDEE